jgi:hypothetical protein
MQLFTYTYIQKNDGHSSPYSTEQKAVMYALGAFYDTGKWKWESINIEKLPRENHEERFLVTIWEPDTFGL